MHYKMTTGWLLALGLHLLPASTIHVPRSDPSSTNDLPPPYNQLDLTDDTPLIVEASFPGTVGQFPHDDCSGEMNYDSDTAHSVNGRVTSPDAHVDYSGDCIAWYPILDQEDGPSIGVDFGGGDEHVQHVDFFKSNPACEADEKKSSLEGDVASSSCCNKSAGGFLGTINSDGIANDFGATKQLGLTGPSDICAQIGVGHNQTLWDTRYVSMTFGA